MATPSWSRLILCLALVSGSTRPAGANAETAPAAAPGPASRQRLLHSFDFEERAKGNFEDLPRHWHIIGRKPKDAPRGFEAVPLHAESLRRSGFPTFTQVRFDTTAQTSGQHALYLGLDGGNAGAFVEAGLLPATPGSDYQVRMMVRTTSLKHARAQAVAYFIDAAGHRIEGSLAASPAVTTDGRWQPLVVRLAGEFKQAAWVGLELLIAQPQAQAADTLGAHEIVYRDIAGGAWFDDVEIWQVPRVVLGTQNPVNLIPAREAPVIRADVTDQPGQKLLAELVLRDQAGDLVGRWREELTEASRGQLVWRPALERYGWYRAELTLYDASALPPLPARAGPVVVAQAACAFVWLAPQPAIVGAEAGRFTLDATGCTDAELSLLVEVMEQTGLGSATISCFDRHTRQAALDQRQALLDSVIEPMFVSGRQVSLALTPLPDELVSSLDTTRVDLMGMLAGPEGVWKGYLAPILMLQGQHVSLWQVGAADQPLPAGGVSPEQFGVVLTRFRNLAPQPRLVMPWSAEAARPTELAQSPAAAFSVLVPAGVAPDAILARLTDWAEGPARYVLRLQPLDVHGAPPARRVQDLALRMIRAAETGASGVAVASAWTLAPEGRPSLSPDPVLGVFRNVAGRLAGRRAVGRLELGPGLHCVVFDGPARGMLAVWSESAERSGLVDIYLGGRPVAVDLWGNRRDVPLLDNRHRVEAGPAPIFIEGVDAALALFRASFQVEPGFLESVQRPQECVASFTNPWKQTISGSMLVVQPRNWYVEPRRTTFTLASGQTVKVPLQVRFPASELAGRKELVVRVDFIADQSYQINLAAPLEVGLRGVRFDAGLNAEVNARTGTLDAVVTATLTNTSREPVSVYAFAHLAGFPRQERIISRLEPEQTVVRRFRFLDGGAPAQAGFVRVGLRETAGPAMLNRILSVAATQPSE